MNSSGTTNPLFVTMSAADVATKLADLPAETKYVLVQNADNTWEVNVIKRSDNNVEIKPLSSDKKETREKIQELHTALAAPDANQNNTVSDLITAVNELVRQVPFRQVDRIYNELLVTEKTFITNMKNLVNFMDNTVSPKLTAAKQAELSQFMQPYRKIIAVDLFPKEPDPAVASQSEADTLKKVKVMHDAIVSMQNNKAELTANAAAMLEGLSVASAEYTTLNKLVDNDFYRDLAKGSVLGTLGIPSHTIMAAQRGPRYFMLLEQATKLLRDVDFKPEERVTVSQEFAQQESFLAANLKTINAKILEYETIENFGATQKIVGDIAKEGKDMHTALISNKSNLGQIGAVENMLSAIDNISDEINRNRQILGTPSTQNKNFVTPQQKFLEPFVTAFASAYLAHKPGAKKDTVSAMLDYMENIDKNMRKAGLPPIVFEKGAKVASSTIFTVLATADPAIRDNVVKAIHSSTFAMLQASHGTAMDKIAYERAQTAIKIMGPAALATWNAQPGKLPLEAKFKDQISQAKAQPALPTVSVYTALNTAAAAPPIAPTAAAAQTTALPIPREVKIAVGEIAKQLVNAAKKIKPDMVQKNIFDNYSLQMQSVGRQIADGKFPREKLYAATMDAFIDSFMQHKKHSKDIESVIRGTMKNIDKDLQKMGIEGIVYQQDKDLKATHNKDAIVLQSLVRHPEYVNAKLPALFSQLQEAYQKNSPEQAQALRRQMVTIVNAMGNAAVDKWNVLADAQSNTALLMETKSGLHVDVASTTKPISQSGSDMSPPESPISSTPSSRRPSISTTSESDSEPDLFPGAPKPLSQMAAELKAQAKRNADNAGAAQPAPAGIPPTAFLRPGTPPPAPGVPPVTPANEAKPPINSADLLTSLNAGKNPPAPAQPPAPVTPTNPPPLLSTVRNNLQNLADAAALAAAAKANEQKKPPPPLPPRRGSADTAPTPPTATTTGVNPAPNPFLRPARGSAPTPTTPITPAATTGANPAPNPFFRPAPGPAPTPSTPITPAATTTGANPAPNPFLRPAPGVPLTPTRSGKLPPPLPTQPTPAPVNNGAPLPPPKPVGKLQPGIAAMLDKLRNNNMPPPTTPGNTTTAPTATATTSTVTTTKSSLQTTTAAPLINSTRDHGFLDQAAGMKTALESNGWKLTDEKQVNSEKLREATFDSGGVHREFTIAQKEMRTQDADVETFKMMLKCFSESNTVLPTITTTTDDLKAKWAQAFQEVYPAKTAEINKLILVKPTAPAVDQTQGPAPPPPASPRPR
jgi:hypothetical protein